MKKILLAVRRLIGIALFTVAFTILFLPLLGGLIAQFAETQYVRDDLSMQCIMLFMAAVLSCVLLIPAADAALE